MGGFKHWFQGLELIGMFLIAVALPCFFIALWGSKMINDLGNHPTKSAQILSQALGRIIVVEIISFTLLIGLYSFLYNLQNA